MIDEWARRLESRRSAANAEARGRIEKAMLDAITAPERTASEMADFWREQGKVQSGVDSEIDVAFLRHMVRIMKGPDDLRAVLDIYGAMRPRGPMSSSSASQFGARGPIASGEVAAAMHRACDVISEELASRLKKRRTPSVF